MRTLTSGYYLDQLLATQYLTYEEEKHLCEIAEDLKKRLSNLEGHPQFYYAGSFGKDTIVRESYDLDLVVYWPSTAQKYSIQGIYESVGNLLEKQGFLVNSKNVCWEIPCKGGFHIDVVPGRALDPDFYEVNLYRVDRGTTLKTSLKAHIDIVTKSKRTPVIKLMKLWRYRQGVPFKKSFLLELMTIEGCKGKRVDDLEGQFFAALKYISANIINCYFEDPANSNNIISEDLFNEQKRIIKRDAERALSAKRWEDIFLY